MRDAAGPERQLTRLKNSIGLFLSFVKKLAARTLPTPAKDAAWGEAGGPPHRRGASVLVGCGIPVIYIFYRGIWGGGAAAPTGVALKR